MTHDVAPHGDRPHALYRFYADDGALLYVGITLNPSQRWPDHRDHKPWWTQVTRITIETHPNRDTALQAERAAIITEHPHHNVVHNRGHATATTEPDDYYGTDFGLTADTMPDQCEHCLRAGQPNIYYPFRWINGIARYVCAASHYWTCWWSHNNTGHDTTRAGTPSEVFA